MAFGLLGAFRAVRLAGLAMAAVIGAIRAEPVINLVAPPGPLASGQRSVFQAEVAAAEPGSRIHWLVLEHGVPVGRPQGIQVRDREDGTLELQAWAETVARTLLVRVWVSSAEAADVYQQVEIQVDPRTGPGTEPPWRPPDTIWPLELEQLVLDYCDRARLERRILAETGPPFRNPASPGGRFGAATGAPVVIREWPLWVNDGQDIPQNRPLLGYGCPATFSWDPPPAGARQLFSFLAPQRGQGEDAVCRELPAGASATTEAFTEPVQSIQVETLWQEAGVWRSELFSTPPTVRGLLPLAGNPVAGAGHQDGRGTAARLRAPLGIAALAGEDRWDLVFGHGRPEKRWLCVAADPEAHVLRVICADGTVLTLGGGPGEAGAQDGPLAEARFNGPTFIHAGHPRFDWAGTRFLGYEFLVADTGNHSIRKVGLDGQVVTLAGSGEAGWRDSDSARSAAFNRPLGLALGPDDSVYVADAGNAVIRRIRGGRVYTLAGKAGARGTADGTGSEARFMDLKGLAMDPLGTSLYAADGHGIRKLMLNLDGTASVSTVLGSVRQPGFTALLVGGDREMLRPCLDDPWGIACCGNFLWIADRGNHAVRAFHAGPGQSCLITVAGDPGRPVLAPGLLRDSMAHLPGTGFGTLAAPLGIATVRARHGTVYVSSGSCLMQLQGTGAFVTGISFEQEPQGPRVVAPARVKAAEPFRVGLSLPAGVDTGKAYDYRYTVDFIEPDQTLGLRRQGQGTFTASPLVSGELALQGRGTIRLTLVTPEGLSTQVQENVVVE